MTTCEKSAISAISFADVLYESELEKFLNLKTSVAEMKAKTLPAYMNNYSCHLHQICAAMQNPGSTDLSDGNFSPCKKTSTQELETKLNADFSSCTKVLQIEQKKIYSRCEAFVSQKISNSKRTLSEKFFTVVSVENQSFLSSKILDLRQKMQVLLEKTRIFSRHFNIVVDGINCTIPDPSY